MCRSNPACTTTASSEPYHQCPLRLCVLLCTRNARPECESVDAMRSQVFTFQILDDPEDRAQDVAIRLEQKVCAALAPRMCH